MISVDTRDLFKVLKNSINYSEGFFEGINKTRVAFNTQLGQITLEALNKYIDARARANPNAFHHVYEWNRVGSPSGRLFDINYFANSYRITFSGEFLPSKSTSENSTEPFVDKANIMENRIGIEVEPSDGGVLAFEIDGQTVFTTKSIYIANPGGDEVANSFGNAVNDFFTVYFTTTLLKQSGIIDDLSKASEFTAGWSRNSTRASGINAGRKYLSIKGSIE